MSSFLDQSGLSVGALNVLKGMGGAWSVERVLTLTYDQLMARPACGKKKTSEIIAFQERCRAGEVQDAGSVVIPRENDPLPPLAVANLSKRTRNILIAQGIEMTPRGICALDRERVHGFEGAGNVVVSELMAFKARCLNGDVWNDEVHEVAEEVPHPERFPSLAEYVLAVAVRTCRMGPHAERIMAEYMGLLNVNAVRTLESMGAELGGLTRERVRQISVKLEKGLFLERGKALFAEFVQCCEVIFARNRFVLREGELVAGLNEVYPGWSGTTEFSALRLLEGCGISIEKNASGRMAWMDGGAVKERYDIYFALLEDSAIPLENLTFESLNRDAGVLGLDAISEDEYRFIVQRVFDHYHPAKGTARARWSLFLRLRCGLHASDAERRRFVVSRALRAAGMQGLTYAELVPACKAIDPSVDIGEEHNIESDANPLFKYDMDGTGTRLFVYDFGGRTHDKRFSLDVFFKDDELVRLIKAAGRRLCRHMERNCLGAANITRLRREIQADLPEAYADGLPSACLYALMREHEAGGLRYYDHPNVAHPGILDADGKARDINTYVRAFLIDLGRTGYSFSDDEKAELADPGWCEAHLGICKAAFLPAGAGSTPPNTNYFKATYRVGNEDYWVSSYWVEKYKSRFDKWAQDVACRAGIDYVPYALPSES